METKEKLRRGAYTAVGAPVAGYKAARQNVSKLADSVERSQRNLKSDVVREFDQWVAEGEIVVDRMLEWLRSSGIDQDIRSLRRSATEKVRAGMGEIGHRVDDALNVIEPEISLTEVRGIGPANAAKLNQAGIQGITSLLDATSTENGLIELAERADIPDSSLREWRSRVELTRIKGIGESYQRLLHSVGIGTMTHLLNSESTKLASSIEKVDQPGMPDQFPSEQEVSRWIEEARKLDL